MTEMTTTIPVGDGSFVKATPTGQSGNCSLDQACRSS